MSHATVQEEAAGIPVEVRESHAACQEEVEGQQEARGPSAHVRRPVVGGGAGAPSTAVDHL